MHSAFINCKTHLTNVSSSLSFNLFLVLNDISSIAMRMHTNTTSAGKAIYVQRGQIRALASGFSCMINL